MTFSKGEPIQAAALRQTRWREHELTLVTVLCVLSLAGNAWTMLTTPSATLDSLYGREFFRNNLSFNYFLNVCLPNAGLIILLYLCYLQMSFFILPRLLQTDAPVRGSFNVRFAREGGIEMKGASGLVLKRTLAGILYTFIIGLCLGAGWGIAAYFSKQYLYLQPGDIAGNKPIILGVGLRNAFFAIFCYLLYASLREVVIRNISQEGQWKHFRIRFVNEVTTWLTIYFSLFYFLKCFHIMDEKGVSVFLLFVVPPFVLGCLSNLYWLFPLKEDKSLFKAPFFGKWILSTGCFIFPFAICMSLAFGGEPGIFVLCLLWGCLLQLVLMTPISWLIYRRRKEKILRFKGLEIALDQSKADLQFLRSQINPHFLFNSLNTLYGTALQENAPRSAEGIQKLGDMMRFMLHENNQEMIPMYKELEYLANYVDLQKLRTQSSPAILIESDIEADHCNHMIAPMLLIPFVENAFKHGISLQEKSWVKIHLQCNAKGILFEVRNSVHSYREQEKEKSGIGMKNVMNRLQLIYPGMHEFFVNGSEKEFFVQLQIQLTN